MMKKTVFLSFLFSAISFAGMAQINPDSLKLPASIQLFDILPTVTPWLYSSNPTALSLPGIKSFNAAWIGYSFDEKEIKFTHQPGRTGSFSAGTKGYKTIRKTSFFGSFGYYREKYNEIKYNSTLVFDTWNPYLVADTVGGEQSKEEFDVSGAVSTALSDKLTFGISTDYLSAYGAKHKDPRSLNTISRFSFTPGFTYKFTNLKLGISASLFTRANNVDIKIFGVGRYPIFVFRGLGLYDSEEDVSDAYSVRYCLNGKSVSTQLGYKKGKVENLFLATLTLSTEKCLYGSPSFRYIFGQSRNEDYSFSDILIFTQSNVKHTFELDAHISYLYGNDEYDYKTYQRYLNGYEYDSIVLFSYQKNAIINSDKGLKISYNYIRFRSSGLKDIKAGAAISVKSFDTGHYPLNVYGGYFNTIDLESTINISKTLNFSGIIIEPLFEGYFRTKLDSEMSYANSTKFMPEILTRNYDAIIATIYGGSLSVSLEKALHGRFIRTIYLVPQGLFYYSPDLSGETARNYLIKASAGFTF
jgi:hypothetical protein